MEVLAMWLWGKGSSGIISSRKGRRKDKDSPQDESKPYLQDEYVSQSINIAPIADLDRLVELPQGLDNDEWIATHTISFFEHINLMYGTLSEYCTTTACSSVTGPGNMQYFWFDEKGKKCKCTAPQYIDFVMTFTQTTLLDESVFPTKYGEVFPCTFLTVVRKVHRLLFSVLAHMYHAHFKDVVQLTLHPHLNLLLEHFLTFGRHMGLLDDKDTELLDDLYEKLKKARVKQVLLLSQAEANGSCVSVGVGDDNATTTLPASPSDQDMGVRDASPTKDNVVDSGENKENMNEGQKPQVAASS